MESYSPEVLSQWMEYKDVMIELNKRGLKPAVIYPAGHCLMLPSKARKSMNEYTLIIFTGQRMWLFTNLVNRLLSLENYVTYW